MGPPEIVPSSLKRRCFTASELSANFKDIPSIAPTNIQNVAPGPPIEIATATPAILPSPNVPDKAVASA